MDEKGMTDIIKNFMLQDKRRETEYVSQLKDQIKMLMEEITRKNYIIDEQLLIIKTFSQQHNRAEKKAIETRPRSMQNVNNDSDAIIHQTTKPRSSHITHSTSTLNECSIKDNGFILRDDNETYFNLEKDDVQVDCQDNNWVTERRRNKVKKNKTDNINGCFSGEDIESINRYTALQFTTNTQEADEVDTVISEDENHGNNTIPTNITTRRPNVVINNFPERDIAPIPIRPGNKSYQQAVTEERNIMVFSTSMTKGIRIREFNQYVENGNASFRRFHGAKARHVKNYVTTHLSEEHPDTVIIQAGGNDLPTQQGILTPVDVIAENIIETGQICRTYGCKDILISSVMTRKTPYVARRALELNNILKGLCDAYNFIFINNSNIQREDIASDGVHLNENGTVKLAKNFINSLNEI